MDSELSSYVTTSCTTRLTTDQPIPEDILSPVDDNESSIHQQPLPTDSYGSPLIDITKSPSTTGNHPTAGPSRTRIGARGEGGILRLPLDDCFKLGKEGSDWVETEESGRPEMYDV